MDVDKLKFTRDHEWVSLHNNIGRVGISDYAQKELGEIVFVETPKTGSILKKGDIAGTLESVKSVSEVYSPLSGRVVNINSELEDEPGKINDSPYNEGWIFELEITDHTELDSLMNFKEYEEYIKTL